MNSVGDMNSDEDAAGAGPAWSVVVPTKDRRGPMCRLLDALTRVEPPAGGFEVIVVDDGSDVPYTAVMEDFAGLLDLRVIRQDNQGPAAARNHGLREARGRWVAFTDDDCAPEPGWLTALDRCARANPRSMIGGRCVNVLDDNGWSEASEFVAAASETATNFVTSNNLGCDRQGLERLGGFDESFAGPAGEDRALSTAFLERGGAVIRCDDAVVRHAHRLDGRGFWRQHRRFGQAVRAVGAADAGAVQRGQRMSAATRIQMLTDAYDRGGPDLLARVLLSQVAVVTGLLGDAAGEVVADVVDGAVGDLISGRRPL